MQQKNQNWDEMTVSRTVCCLNEKETETNLKNVEKVKMCSKEQAANVKLASRKGWWRKTWRKENKRENGNVINFVTAHEIKKKKKHE